MKINIPNDNSFNTEINEYSMHQMHPMDKNAYEKIVDYLNIEPWLCQNCGLKNFGRNEKCANFRCKKEKVNE